MQLKKNIILSICISTVIVLMNCTCSVEKKNTEVHKEKSETTVHTDSYTTLVAYISAVTTELQQIFPEEKIADPTPFTEKMDNICAHLKNAGKEQLHSPHLVDSILSLVYDTWQITFDPDRENLSSLLPHTVITSKRGSCLGVSLLFLLIAEKLHYPLYGILLPGHFFVRYDDGNVYRNIEPNKKGYNHPLAYYRWRYEVEDNSWYTMKNLSLAEVIAVVNYNLANICIKKGKVTQAKQFYRGCLAGLPDFAEAWGNYALAFIACRQPDSARLAFRRAYSLQPDLPGLAQNRGAFELGLAQYDSALAIYQNGLRYFSDDSELLYGAAYSFYSLGCFDSAVVYLRRVGDITDIAGREYKLYQLIKENQLRKK